MVARRTRRTERRREWRCARAFVGTLAASPTGQGVRLRRIYSHRALLARPPNLHYPAKNNLCRPPPPTASSHCVRFSLSRILFLVPCWGGLFVRWGQRRWRAPFVRVIVGLVASASLWGKSSMRRDFATGTRDAWAPRNEECVLGREVFRIVPGNHDPP